MKTYLIKIDERTKQGKALVAQLKEQGLIKEKATRAEIKSFYTKG